MSLDFCNNYDNLSATCDQITDLNALAAKLESIDQQTKQLYVDRDQVETELRDFVGVGVGVLYDGRLVTVKDNFKDANGDFINAAYRPARVQHYSVVIAAPKKAKAK